TNADRDLESQLSAGKTPVYDVLGYELAVRDDDRDIVVRPHDRAPSSNTDDAAVNIIDLNAVADLYRPFEQNDQSANEIIRNVLQAETDTDTDRAGENIQRRQIYSNGLKYDQEPDEKDQITRDRADRVLRAVIESRSPRQAGTEKPFEFCRKIDQRDRQQKRVKNAERRYLCVAKRKDIVVQNFEYLINVIHLFIYIKHENCGCHNCLQRPRGL